MDTDELQALIWKEFHDDYFFDHPDVRPFYPNERDPEVGKVVEHTALALSEETGELIGKIRRLGHVYNYRLTPEISDAIRAEMGDVLWMLSRLANSLGYNLSQVADEASGKFLSRKKRGVLLGQGDNR